jgi:predicted RNase H-like nuclease (RuvC/YqgF family)
MTVRPERNTTTDTNTEVIAPDAAAHSSTDGDAVDAYVRDNAEIQQSHNPIAAFDKEEIEMLNFNYECISRQIDLKKQHKAQAENEKARADRLEAENKMLREQAKRSDRLEEENQTLRSQVEIFEQALQGHVDQGEKSKDVLKRPRDRCRRV